MAIGVQHNPGFSQYGQAMYDSSRNVENYDRFQKLMELLMRRRQMEQEATLQREQMANQSDMQQRQLDRQYPVVSGFQITNPNNPVQTIGQGSGNDDWMDRTRAYYASKGIRI